MTAQIKYLGRVEYEPTWRAMQAANKSRTPETEDEFWIVEHAPVFTLGLAGKPEHVLAPGDIPVVKIDRGGQVTYHGPGQLVVYLLLDLKKTGYGVKELVKRIEQSVIDLLAEYGIDSFRLASMPGVYVSSPSLPPLSRQGGEALSNTQAATLTPSKSSELHGGANRLASPPPRGDRRKSPWEGGSEGEGEQGEVAKIAAIGLRVANHATYHGLSLNIDMDLEPFSRINPCGYEGLAVTQMRELGVTDKMSVIGEKLVSHLKSNLYSRSS